MLYSGLSLRHNQHESIAELFHLYHPVAIPPLDLRLALFGLLRFVAITAPATDKVYIS